MPTGTIGSRIGKLADRTKGPTALCPSPSATISFQHYLFKLNDAMSPRMKHPQCIHVKH